MTKLYFNPDCLYSYLLDENITSRIVSKIDSFEYTSFTGGTIKSFNNDISLFKDEYSDLFDFLHKIINNTLKDLGTKRSAFLNLSNNITITQIWAAVNKPNTSYVEQSHPNSLFTGIIFLDDWDENFGKLNVSLEDPGIWSVSFLNVNNKKISLGMKRAGGIVLFPSKLKVSIEKNLSDKNQKFLFFNTFIDGSFGNVENQDRLSVSSSGVKASGEVNIEEISLHDQQSVVELIPKEEEEELF